MGTYIEKLQGRLAEHLLQLNITMRLILHVDIDNFLPDLLEKAIEVDSNDLCLPFRIVFIHLVLVDEAISGFLLELRQDVLREVNLVPQLNLSLVLFIKHTLHVLLHLIFLDALNFILLLQLLLLMNHLQVVEL